MEKTNVIASSPNLVGNLGSCSVVSTNVSINSFYTETIAVNSCTGDIVSQNTYFDWGNMLVVGIVLGLIVILGGMVLRMFLD